MSFSRLFFYIVAGAILLGAADQAYAWGPATHVALGNSILSQLGLLPAGIAAILARHAVAYLYGNIAADIVFAKRLSKIKQFCHHWSTGLGVLQSAPTDRDRAFAYGYLSHLAADTVAHGKFVPRQVMVSDCSVNFGHFYWELRADSAQPAPVWTVVERVLGQDHAHHHLQLSGHLRDTLLSFEVNRILFERMNALAIRRGFRRTVDTWNRYSRFELLPGTLAGYHNECIDRILSVLQDGRRSPVLREDPNGASALSHVKFQRRLARRVHGNERLAARRRREAAHAWAPRPGWKLSSAGRAGLPVTDPPDVAYLSLSAAAPQTVATA
jgi:hypothetical protein